MGFSLGPPLGRPLKQHNPRNQVRMDSFECLGILMKKKRERDREGNSSIKVASAEALYSRRWWWGREFGDEEERKDAISDFQQSQVRKQVQLLPGTG